MRHRPPGETPKDRRNKWIVGLGVVIIFALIAVVVFEGVINYQSQTNHHASTVKSDKQITQLLKEVKASQADHEQTLQEIKSLEKQVANVISGLPAADAKLAEFAVWLEICVNRFVGFLVVLVVGIAIATMIFR